MVRPKEGENYFPESQPRRPDHFFQKGWKQGWLRYDYRLEGYEPLLPLRPSSLASKPDIKNDSCGYPMFSACSECNNVSGAGGRWCPLGGTVFEGLTGAALILKTQAETSRTFWSIQQPEVCGAKPTPSAKIPGKGVGDGSGT